MTIVGKNLPPVAVGDTVTVVGRAVRNAHPLVEGHEAGRGPTERTCRKPVAGGRSYDLAFSTFFGGKMDCRGMTVDAQGNVYLAGSTWDAECPTTEGAYDRTFHGEADMAISKWSPEGKLLWSTLVGSPGHDRPYSVKVDSQGCVYAAGIGGVGMPVSPDAFQPKPLARTKNAKIPGEEYVGANGYIVKLSADGSKVLWGSYVGNNIECRDLAIDDEDNLYLTFGWLKDSAGELPASWFANAYCKRPHAGRTPPGRVEDLGVMKVSSDGKKVFWATYIGGTGGNALEASLCVGPDHCPVVFTGTASRDMPTTPGVFSNKPNVLLAGQVLRRWVETDLRHLPGCGEGVVPQDARRGHGFPGEHLRHLLRGRHLAHDPRRLPAEIRRRQDGFRHRQALADGEAAGVHLPRRERGRNQRPGHALRGQGRQRADHQRMGNHVARLPRDRWVFPAEHPRKEQRGLLAAVERSGHAPVFDVHGGPGHEPPRQRLRPGRLDLGGRALAGAGVAAEERLPERLQGRAGAGQVLAPVA